MTTTVYIDGNLPAVNAAWLNDVNLLTYDLCGDGVLAALTKADVISNLGLISAADIASTYLTQADAASTYLSQADASSNYLTQSDAAATYATISGSGAFLTIASAAATYAPLASPHFTGVPTAPTAAPGTNTTQLATTAFVTAAITAAVPGGSGIVEGTAQVSTSGTSINFTSIPNTVKSVRVMLKGISHALVAGNQNFLVQIGGSGAIETSGYDDPLSNAGFSIPCAGNSSAITGCVTLSRLQGSSFTWVASGNTFDNNGPTNSSVVGSKILTDALTKVTIKNEAGAAFDAGLINIQYES